MGEGILIYGVKKRTARTEAYFHEESKRLRREVLVIADGLKNSPLRFSLNNGISMNVEITKTDLKTIVGKNTRSAKFNAIKNALARNIPFYLRKAKYEGWRKTEEGKHFESVYFVYYSRKLGQKSYLVLRKMRNNGRYKPYAIISERMFAEKAGTLIKGTPP